MGTELLTIFAGVSSGPLAGELFLGANPLEAVPSLAVLQAGLLAQCPETQEVQTLSATIDRFFLAVERDDCPTIDRLHCVIGDRLKSLRPSFLRFFGGQWRMERLVGGRKSGETILNLELSIVSPDSHSSQLSIVSPDSDPAVSDRWRAEGLAVSSSPRPQRPEDFLLMGWRAFSSRQFENAARFFERASQVYWDYADPEKAAVAIGLASIAWKKGGKREEGQRTWKVALTRMGALEHHATLQIYLLVGQSLSEKKQFGIAATLFEKGARELRNNGDDIGAGLLLYQLGLVLVRSQSPIDAYIAFLRADALVRLGGDRETTNAGIEAEKLREEGGLDFLNGVVARLQGRGQKILETDTRSRRAEILLRFGKIREAIDDFSWLARYFERVDKKRAADFYFNVGKLLEGEGNFSDAEKAYGKARYFYSSSNYLTEAREAFLARVDVLRKSGRGAEAQELLDRLEPK